MRERKYIVEKDRGKFVSQASIKVENRIKFPRFSMKKNNHKCDKNDRKLMKNAH